MAVCSNKAGVAGVAQKGCAAGKVGSAMAATDTWAFKLGGTAASPKKVKSIYILWCAR